MRRVFDITFIVLCVASLCVIAYAVSTCASTVTPAPEPAAVAPAEDELCGRYHYRSRTTRFFKRSVG